MFLSCCFQWRLVSKYISKYFTEVTYWISFLLVFKGSGTLTLYCLVKVIPDVLSELSDNLISPRLSSNTCRSSYLSLKTLRNLFVAKVHFVFYKILPTTRYIVGGKSTPLCGLVRLEGILFWHGVFNENLWFVFFSLFIFPYQRLCVDQKYYFREIRSE